MIESVQFTNFKALRDTTLPLGRFTLIVGPNGSGKSTALQGLQAVHNPSQLAFKDIVYAGLRPDEKAEVVVSVHWREPEPDTGSVTSARWFPDRVEGPGLLDAPSISGSEKSLAARVMQRRENLLNSNLATLRVYSFDAHAISAPSRIGPNIKMSANGANLTAVLDQLRDQNEDRFEALNEELERWLPEFDRVSFDTPIPDLRFIALRTREGKHKIPASELSQGTLLALAMLTLAYIPDPPPIICIEEPDRGIHPRLLRNVQDALYRLSYPESAGENREPVQVIATTHSPYLLDLYSEHPEDIVIASKDEQGVRFERLSDMPHIDEILQGTRLGDIWYTGILGGVPSHP